MHTWGASSKVEATIVTINGRQWGLTFDGADFSVFLLLDAKTYTDYAIRA